MTKRPYHWIGWDIHLRLCWRWPFTRWHVNRVWHISEIESIRSLLPKEEGK